MADPSSAAAAVSADGGDAVVGVHGAASRAIERALSAGRRVAEAPAVLRDDRRCDFALAAVALPPAVDSRVVATREELYGRAAGDEPADPDGRASLELEWRRQLELHVVGLLRQVRQGQETMTQFLQLVAMAALPPESHKPSSATVDAETGGIEASTAPVPRELASGAAAKRMFQELHRTACIMGEDVYRRVHHVMQRSVTRGALSLEANAVRLESVFKLELRRQVTLESVMKRVTALRRLGNIASDDGAFPVDPDPVTLSATDEAVGVTHDSATKQRARSAPAASKRERLVSAHTFKMKALERILNAEWQNDALLDLHVTVGVDFELDEAESDLIKERVTSYLYHRSRENFPFWREPPENTLSRDETARLVRSVLGLLLATPLFRGGLSIDQLIEMARAMRWKHLQSGETACVEGSEANEMLILVDGELEVTRSDDSDFVTPLIQHETKTNSVENGDDLNTEPEQTGATTITAPSWVGELAMVRQGSRWKLTLIAGKSPAKLLVLSRQAFDALLQRMFSVGKPREALAQTLPQPPSSRPVSSPSGIGGRRRSKLGEANASTISPTRIAVVNNIACMNHPRRDDQSDNNGDGSIGGGRVGSMPKLIMEVSTASRPLSPKNTASSPVDKAADRSSSRRPGTASMFQHYPTFDCDGSTDGDVASMFRLKWAQPIAFPMATNHTQLKDEWAPSFPETPALVDFLSATSSASIRMLFQRDNMLSIDCLRAVCRHRPFLDTAYSFPADKVKSSDGLAVEITTTGIASAPSSPTHRTSIAIDPAKSEVVSLSQFTESRKKTMSGRASSVRLRSASSSNSLRGLPWSASRNGGSSLEPFVGSTFVAEASFRVGGRPSMLDDSVSLDDESDGSDDEFEVDRIETKSMDAGLQPHEEEPTSIKTPDEPASDAVDKEEEATLARKKALDSLIQTGPTATHMSQVIDTDTAKQALATTRRMPTATSERVPLDPIRSPRSPSKVVRFDPQRPPQTHTQEKAQATASAPAPLPLRADLQRRMDIVLTGLRLRAKAKLELVLKYTHADHYDKFPLAVVLWEQTLRFVRQREDLLDAVRRFELVASDPRRHFRTLSTHRLTEQKERDTLLTRLNGATELCRESLDELNARCGDEVWLGDRQYRDKMKKDYTELLFEVEQERLRLIYRGVKPAITGDGSLGLPHRNESEVDAARSASKTSASMYVHLPSVSRGATPPWSHLTKSTNQTSGSDSDAMGTLSPELCVAGDDLAPRRARFQLATPQESIYLSAGEQLLEEERVRDEEGSRRDSEQAEAPVKARGLKAHRMAAQVQAKRQADLDALTKQLQSQLQQKAAVPPSTSRPRSLRTSSARQQGNANEIRPVERVVAHGPGECLDSEQSALRQMLRAFVTQQQSAK